MNQFLNPQFIRFIIANTLAALANIATRLVASQALLDTWALVAGFCAGLLTSYLLCRGFVFRTMRRASFSEIARFICINYWPWE